MKASSSWPRPSREFVPDSGRKHSTCQLDANGKLAAPSHGGPHAQHRSPFLSRVLVAARGGASVGRAGEAQRPWSQADVVALTEQLSTALDELLAVSGLRAQQPRVAVMRKRVASGYDREVSQPFFEQVAELREEIAAYAGESWLPDTTRKKPRHVRALFDRLARYYP